MKKPAQKKNKGGKLLAMLSGPSAPTGVTGMKAGGKVTRGDGVCTKGHTKGKMV
jgi:hypothetical protein